MQEFETIVPGGAGFPQTPVFACLPPYAHRGVVVIHEIYGRQPEIDDVVRRFAQHGYAAVEPDLWRAPSALGCIRNTMRALRTGHGPVVAQAAAIRTWLAATAGISERHVGIIGFCFGGGFALAVGRGWGAISTNYGRIPGNLDVLRGLGPTIGCYGGRDRVFRSGAERLEARLGAAGVEVETHTFAEAGHSFLTNGRHPIADVVSAPLLHIAYKPEIAEEGWRRIMAFFDKHLAVTSA